MKDIPQEWIKKYVDSLLEGARKLGPDTRMGQAVLQRADAIMDMVKAFKEHSK